MRKLTADYIFPASSSPLKGGVVITDDKGFITDVLSEEDISFPKSGIEKFQGIICPGFINTHCHLELSHLKGKISEGTGLDGFILDLQKVREASEEEILSAMEAAESEMISGGVVAVGDISNSRHSFKQKEKADLFYHTFFEVFGFDPSRADANYEYALQLQNEYNALLNEKAHSSIVPHAPYSVSEKLFRLIGSNCYENDGLISMHNQETEEENLFFSEGKGKLKNMLGAFNLDLSGWKATGYNSLPSVMVHLPKCNKILLVHNTYTTKKDLEWAEDYSKMCWWCLCPKANLYIEKRLPDIEMFHNSGLRITLGTDSLASNDSLSILEEMKTIQQHLPQISLEELLKWATYNGADFLGLKDFGSIEKGKKAALNLIEHIDLENFMLKKESVVRVISTAGNYPAKH